MLEGPDIGTIHAEDVGNDRDGQGYGKFGDQIHRAAVDKGVDQLRCDLPDLRLQRAHAARAQSLTDEFAVSGVLWRVCGEKRIHDGVRVGQDLFNVILHGFAIDAHVPRAAVVLGDSGGVNRSVFGERRERVVACDDRSNVGVDAYTTRLMELCIHFIGALNMPRISEVYLSRFFIICHRRSLLPC